MWDDCVLISSLCSVLHGVWCNNSLSPFVGNLRPFRNSFDLGTLALLFHSISEICFPLKKPYCSLLPNIFQLLLFLVLL